MNKISISNFYKTEDNTPPCPLFESLTEHIEQTGGSLSKEFESHIESCSLCKEYYEFWQNTEQWLLHTREKGEEEFITEWEKQISIQKIKQKIQTEQRQKRVLTWGLVSAIAGILFLILALFYFFPSTQAPSVQAIEQAPITNSPSSDYSGNSIPYNITPEKELPDKDM